MELAVHEPILRTAQDFSNNKDFLNVIASGYEREYPAVTPRTDGNKNAAFAGVA
jgi:hypothetical protein